MTNIKFFINLVALLIIQLAILDNIQLHSYVYINIYILAIYILPYRLSKASILLFGFFLGLFVDLANNTMGIHAAASTLLAYISFHNFWITLARIVCSTIASVFFIMLYYFIVLKKKQN